MIVQAGMWSSTVVAAQKAFELACPTSRRWVRDDVGPLTQERLNEALCLSVRTRGVRPRADVAERERLAGGPKAARDVATAVVTHHAADGDGPCRKPRDTALEKAGTRVPALVRQDLDGGDPAVIIDGDMDILPADPTRGPAAIAVDPMPDGPNPRQGLDIDMQQVPGVRPLVATHGHPWRGRRATRPPAR